MEKRKVGRPKLNHKTKRLYFTIRPEWEQRIKEIVKPIIEKLEIENK